MTAHGAPNLKLPRAVVAVCHHGVRNLTRIMRADPGAPDKLGIPICPAGKKLTRASSARLVLLASPLGVRLSGTGATGASPGGGAS
jgi:hypothetical protein